MRNRSGCGRSGGSAIAAVVLLLGAIAAFVVAEVQSHRAHTAEQSSRSGELAAQAQAGFLSGDLARGVQLSARHTAPGRSPMHRLR